MRGEAAISLRQVREYWEGYAERVLARGNHGDVRGHLEALRRDHELAYGLANQLLLRRGIRGRALLELGCGLGFDTVFFSGVGAYVVAVDLSGSCVRWTRRHLAWHGLEAEVGVANAECLDLPAGCFDMVTVRGLLMFTPDPAAVLEEAWRVLRPGGTIQAILHHRYSWYVLLGAVGRMNLVDPVQEPQPNRLYTRRDIRALFKRFTDVAITLDRFPTIGSRRAGPAASLYNRLCVPLARRLPGRVLLPFGFYLIVQGTKPGADGRPDPCSANGPSPRGALQW